MLQRSSLILPLLLCVAGPVAAAELQLQIVLPPADISLVATTPPHNQREGAPLPSERTESSALLAAFGTQDFAAALETLKESQASVLELLEAGDPEGLLKQRAVAGGLEPSSGAQRISAAMLYLIGQIYLSMEQYLPAETALLTALGPLPDYLRVHEALGILYLRTGRFDDARRHLARAAGLGLNTANLYGALGYLNNQTDNYWGAVSAFQHAVMLEPETSQWQQGLLYALSQTYQYDSALTLVEQLLLARPGDPDLWLFRASLALQDGQREVALTSLEAAIRLGHDEVANLQVCATLHMELGSIDRAVALLQSGVTRGLDFQFVDQALGWLEQKEEWEHFEALLAPSRTNRDTYTAAGQSRLLLHEASVSLRSNDQPSARNALEQALTLDPSNADALLALARIHHNTRNFNEAELLYQRASAYDLYRENALLALAQLAVDQDNFARALDLLREVLAINPARSDLRRNIDSLENLVLLGAP